MKRPEISSKTLTRVALTVVGVVCMVAALFLVRRFLLNRSFLKSYAAGEYTTEAEQALLTMNTPEGYLPHYNMGNAAYEQGDYDSAVIFYRRALGYYIPAGRECDIRVNLALSMIGRIDFAHLSGEEQIQEAISGLKEARDVLTEVGCADPEGTDGHDPEAEQLKQDIDRMIEQLEQMTQSGGDGEEESEDEQQEGGNQGDQPQQNQSEENGEQSRREKKLQEELERRREDATIDRSEQQRELEEWGSYGGGDDDGEKAGYQGKQW